MTPPSSPAPPDMSIIIPVMNEEGNLTPLVDDILAAFGGRSVEIIMVNDASTDGTAKELKALKKTAPNLRVLTHSHRAGKSAAIRSGVFAAKSELIGTIDGDGQNPPHDLVNLEQQVKAKRPQLVLAAGVRTKRQDSMAKRYASICARHIRRWILKDDHPDTGCGIKVFDRELFLKLPYFDNQHRFMPILARREGACVLAVPVAHQERQRGVSKYRNLDRLLAGLGDLIGVIWLLYRAPKNLKVKE